METSGLRGLLACDKLSKLLCRILILEADLSNMTDHSSVAPKGVYGATCMSRRTTHFDCEEQPSRATVFLCHIFYLIPPAHPIKFSAPGRKRIPHSFSHAPAASPGESFMGAPVFVLSHLPPTHAASSHTELQNRFETSNEQRLFRFCRCMMAQQLSLCHHKHCSQRGIAISKT